MKAEIKDKNLVITIPIDEDGKKSSSGKTTIHATTGGAKEVGVKIKGQPLFIGINAYTYPPKD